MRRRSFRRRSFRGIRARRGRVGVLRRRRSSGGRQRIGYRW